MKNLSMLQNYYDVKKRQVSLFRSGIYTVPLLIDGYYYLGDATKKEAEESIEGFKQQVLILGGKEK